MIKNEDNAKIGDYLNNNGYSNEYIFTKLGYFCDTFINDVEGININISMFSVSDGCIHYSMFNLSNNKIGKFVISQDIFSFIKMIVSIMEFVNIGVKVGITNIASNNEHINAIKDVRKIANTIDKYFSNDYYDDIEDITLITSVDNSKSGWVYVASNPSMPGELKIGETSRTVDERLRELHRTGTSRPYKCELKIFTDDRKKVEKYLHEKFNDKRISRNREWFKDITTNDIIDKINEYNDILRRQ